MKQIFFLCALAVATTSLSAGCRPSAPPQEGKKPQPSKQVSSNQISSNQISSNQISMGGERRDESLQNREDRANNDGETNRADSLQNREDNASTRQDDR
ncbi:MAG: hypothetical protein JSS12_03580 [Verrucomicrobia bacterium]|nr:hypothetical protein [Verrucomicrobiota bacterium]